MGRWLRKAGNLAASMADKLPDNVGESLKALTNTDQYGAAISQLKDIAQRTESAASETIEICSSTQTKREQMIAFAEDILSTLKKLPDGDATVLDTIKDLTDGGKVLAAKELATGLDVAAKSCVEKSSEMLEALDDGMDKLPQVLQVVIEKDDDGDGDIDVNMLKDVEKDLKDVQTCIASIRSLNLVTGLKVGVQAFSQLAEKAKRSQSLFDKISGFASDIVDITKAFRSLQIQDVIPRARQLIRCLRMTDIMKQLARAAGRLMEILIDLFQLMAERISKLWAALAFAKDCMQDCLVHVREVRQICTDAKDRSMALRNKTKSIRDQLASVGDINIKSIQSIRKLSSGGEIQDAIAVAKNMDTMVLECSRKSVAMVDRVIEGFNNLPEILTEGIEPVTAGREDTDPEPVNVDKDIVELENAKRSIESADVVSAAQAGVRGFSGVSTKAGSCSEMIQLIQTFANNCLETIESFMGSWDLEAATNKIMEMCRLVSLGELMKSFAGQIERLAITMIELMKASASKFKSLDLGEIGESFGNIKEEVKDKLDDLTGNAVERLDDLTDDAMGALANSLNDKLKFWK